MSGWSVLDYLRDLNGRADLTHRERVVLTCHALHADATGRTFVGSARVAEEAGIDERACRRVRSSLVARGWLVPTGTHHGRRGEYVVHALSAPAAAADPGSPQPGLPRPGVAATPGRHDPPTPGNGDPTPRVATTPPIGSGIGPLDREGGVAPLAPPTAASPGGDLRNPGPPGDLPGKSADPFYAAIWLDALRSVGLLAPDVRLSRTETSQATRIAREAGGDRDRIEATGRWIVASRAFEASRAREHVERGSLRWLLGDWAELDRLAHANGHGVRPKRETAEQLEARLEREAQRRAADG